jgi:hypothetical protein
VESATIKTITLLSDSGVKRRPEISVSSQDNGTSASRLGKGAVVLPKETSKPYICSDLQLKINPSAILFEIQRQMARILPKPESPWAYKGQELLETQRGFTLHSPEIILSTADMPSQQSFVDEYSLPDLYRNLSLHNEVATGKALLPANDWWRPLASSVVKTSVTAQTGTRYKFLCPWDRARSTYLKILRMAPELHRIYARLETRPELDFSHDEWHTLMTVVVRWENRMRSKIASGRRVAEEMEHDDLIVDLPRFFDDNTPSQHRPNMADMIFPAGEYDTVEMAYWSYYVNQFPMRPPAEWYQRYIVVPLRVVT